MSYTVSGKGIVLKSYDYGHGHRIVVIYTPFEGKIKASAKGSRKTKSRYAALLEPFSENKFMLYRKPGNELYTITGCFPLEANMQLREDMKLFGYASLMLEGLDILSADHDPDRRIYSLLLEFMKELKYKKNSSCVWLFLFRLLKYSGYRLNMFSCVQCAKKADQKMLFIPREGGVGCIKCFSGEKNCIPVSVEALSEIRKLNPERVAGREIQREIGNIIAKFVEYHFNRDFKSFNFISLFDRAEDKCTFRN